MVNPQGNVSSRQDKTPAVGFVPYVAGRSRISFIKKIVAGHPATGSRRKEVSEARMGFTATYSRGNSMKAKMLGTLLACVIVTGCAAQADSGGSMANPMVGGAPMYQSKNIVENAVNSKDHTTLVAAVKAAGLVETLQSPGPFTVFAPTNAAFDKLPAGTVETLVKPENKETLTQILTYHVVPGTLDAKTLMADIAKGGGKAMLKTVNGEDLTLEQNASGIVITDMKGDKSMVTIADVRQSNGVIHVVDTVLLP
jgi:uncharacterized surface protein with fasciclin (FAS1) repeats